MVDEPRNPELEAAIEAAPDDVETYRVLADWLESQGCLPRAQQIRAHIADPYRSDALEVGTVTLSAKDLRWRHGFVCGASLRRAEELAVLLAHPASRFLTDLAFELDDPAPVVRLLAERAPRTLRALLVHTRAPVELRGLAAVFARLERLTLSGPCRLVEPLELPHATELSSLGGQTPEDARRLADAELPAVSRLHLDLEDATVRTVDLEGLFRRDLPAIRRLILGKAEYVDPVCAWLVEAPFAPRLEWITIHGGLTRIGLEMLLASPRLTALATLDVRPTGLEGQQVKVLRRRYAREGLVVIDQRYDDTDD